MEFRAPANYHTKNVCLRHCAGNKLVWFDPVYSPVKFIVSVEIPCVMQPLKKVVFIATSKTPTKGYLKKHSHCTLAGKGDPSLDGGQWK